jgi:hypothetical protein
MCSSAPACVTYPALVHLPMPLQAPANTAPACIPAAYDRTTAPDQAAAPACCVLVAFRLCFLDGELTIHHLNLGTKQVTRLYGPLLDNCWRYAVSGKPAAPGQLPTIYVSGTRELLQIDPGEKVLQAGWRAWCCTGRCQFRCNKEMDSVPSLW